MTIIAAFPYGKKDRSALHLAGLLARSSGESLRIVSIVPDQSTSMIPSGSDLQFAAWSRERGRKAIAEAERAAAEICPDVVTETVAVASRSRAKGLIAEAVAAEASMIVVGSGTEGTRGRIRVSATSDRLLHSSPVPVALAPKGYGASSGRQGGAEGGQGASRITRVTCSFRGDVATQNVLSATAEFARAAQSGLRVATFGVSGRTIEPASLDDDSTRSDYVDHLRAAQEKAVAGLDGSDARPVGAIAEVVGIGRDWKAALSSIAWEPGEILVIGSSSEGRRSRVFLGSNAARIIRHSPVPVLVVP
ncbi:universal stress protein [Brevibacterium oceani]|uniref:universal stress protein n=1 Tax=Brevibacterium oceani TaxID=358099 RepID=UPI001B32800F|nr:universal stress protein [Brevibacterium oceani]